jgi:hypothetical protein
MSEDVAVEMLVPWGKVIFKLLVHTRSNKMTVDVPISANIVGKANMAPLTALTFSFGLSFSFPDIGISFGRIQEVTDVLLLQRY